MGRPWTSPAHEEVIAVSLVRDEKVVHIFVMPLGNADRAFETFLCFVVISDCGKCQACPAKLVAAR
jgi:hypothetical protein